MHQGKQASSERRQLIVNAILNHPEFSYPEIATMLGCSVTYICKVRFEEGLPGRVRGGAAPAHRWFKRKAAKAVTGSDSVQTLIDKTNRLKQEREALKGYWAAILPEELLPHDRQFAVWLNYASANYISDAIDACAVWLNKCDSDNVTKAKDDVVRYLSGVLVKKVRDKE